MPGGTSSEGLREVLAKTVSKPWQGEEFLPGRRGGTWYGSMTADPKSFNLLVAERDGETSAVVSNMHGYLLDYNYITRQFEPDCAFCEVVIDEEAGTLSVIYTLRENLFWSYYNSEEKVPVTSDDVVFWYDEIQGDPAFYSSAYNAQFMLMDDGTTAHIDIERLDERRFAFHFPKIIANPELSTNMEFGPRFIYEKAKTEGGHQAVLDLFNVSDDPQTIPSMGQWFLTEYIPGQRLVYKPNPDYWKKDSNGVTVPYMDEYIVQILPDANTQFLLFKQGNLETYGLRPENLDEMLNRENPDYTVFSAGGALGANFWSFNQNPKNRNTPQYEWFTRTAFRQAMSCLLNRGRIIAQVYRGLAEPKLDFFAEPNPYYNPSIKLEYLYDPKRAQELLSSIGMNRAGDGTMRDEQGRAVEFDLSITADNAITTDTAAIIADECAKIGITVRIRTIDFQKLVEQMTVTFDWQSLLMGFGGINYWPTSGSNVWESSGNLHIWYPQQSSPATEWEARVDYLYNKGSYTINPEEAQTIWDEYQRILLEQCPVIYLVRPRSFAAIRNRWDFTNVYYDNLGGLQRDYVFLKR
ncbi:MAG: ABC transporter substrate-binding protein [Spirochaetaceae bacterium]|nr:ABC transporter substrate-binding protein [Spirochaetaceae bacterium]